MSVAVQGSVYELVASRWKGTPTTSDCLMRCLCQCVDQEYTPEYIHLVPGVNYRSSSLQVLCHCDSFFGVSLTTCALSVEPLPRVFQLLALYWIVPRRVVKNLGNNAPAVRWKHLFISSAHDGPAERCAHITLCCETVLGTKRAHHVGSARRSRPAIKLSCIHTGPRARHQRLHS